MRGFWSEIRFYTAPGIYFLLALMLMILPVSWVTAWLVSICVHEAGHLLAAWMLSVPVRKISVGVFGAKIETAPMDPVQELICAASGPAAGGLLLLFARWFPLLAVFAFCQTLFNLVPAGNLDGRRILSCIAALCRKIPCKPGEERVQ